MDGMTVFHDLGFDGVLYAVWFSLTWCAFGGILGTHAIVVFDWINRMKRGDYPDPEEVLGLDAEGWKPLSK